MTTLGNLSNVADYNKANNAFGSVKNILGPLTAEATALTADRVVVTDSSTKLLKANTDGITAANLAVLSGQSTALSTQFAGKVNTTGTNATISATNYFTGINTFTGTTYLNYAVKAKISTATGSPNPYVVFAGDFIIAVNNETSGAIRITIPSAVTYPNRILIVKDIAGNMSTYAVTLTPSAGNIDGSETLVLNTNYISVTLFSNGTNWFII